MHELWSSESYAPHLLSLPFAFAPAAMLIVVAYAVVMRGEPRVRAWLLAHVMSLLPYAVTMMLAPSMTSPSAALALFRVAAGFVPMAAATGTGFQLTLVGRSSRLAWLGVAACGFWCVAGIVSPAEVDTVVYLRAGLWYAHAGPWAWLALLTTVVASLPGFGLLGAAALRMPPSSLRRQLRLALAANLITYAGLVDVASAYGIEIFPVGWLLSGVGSLLIVRALIIEDLLRVRAVDSTAPLLVFHLAAGVILAWIVLSNLGTTPWWGSALAVVLSLAGVRITVAVVALVNRGAHHEGPLDRLIGQLVTRARDATSDLDVARLGIDIVQLGLGVEPKVLVAAADDWGWTAATGERLPDDAAPDPLLAPWLAEARGALFDTEAALHAPEDLQPMIAALFAAQRARAIVPITSHDELLGLVVVPATAPAVRGRNLAFLERAGDAIGEAIVHVRMARHAARRAELARDVELAATVQRDLLPGREPRTIGAVEVIGSWFPATRCAGDFWAVYSLDGGARVLIAVGDVTGHGVASAMVTAAAVGACDAFVRASGATPELPRLMLALDAAVRRVGGGALSMTCTAAIVDPRAGELSFVSCGHTVPYLVRAKDDGAGVDLQALVARGNLLGTGVPPAAKVQQRAVQAGDLVVWYTDGVIDATDPAGDAFGDRRLQRLLRKLERGQLAPVAVHDRVHAAVVAHRAGRARPDDETLVIARIGASAGAAA
jgi:serine phosphatase RsbU (regulator of sigma subunit)|nr:SpoIIE family protein phosphatase [Kofleriaceae bacterium]